VPAVHALEADGLARQPEIGHLVLEGLLPHRLGGFVLRGREVGSLSRDRRTHCIVHRRIGEKQKQKEQNGIFLNRPHLRLVKFGQLRESISSSCTSAAVPPHIALPGHQLDRTLRRVVGYGAQSPSFFIERRAYRNSITITSKNMFMSTLMLTANINANINTHRIPPSG
jgi:hypothetical protein